jgi:hypothetical protein
MLQWIFPIGYESTVRISLLSRLTVIGSINMSVLDCSRIPHDSRGLREVGLPCLRRCSAYIHLPCLTFVRTRLF